jgi:hypothetical protein
MKPARLFLIPVLLIAGPRVAAADFAPVTDAERALTAVPGEPNARAVVLFKKAEFLMTGYKAGAFYPYFRVTARVKILTEEGKSSGEIAVGHSDFERLQSFEARTVLPDDRVVPVPREAKFRRRLSRSARYYTTVIAFPAVEVGAILDYSYELKLDSAPVPDAWFFSDEIPVLYSEIVYKLPRSIQARMWTRDPFQVGIQRESHESSRGFELRAWARDLPSVPDDPFGPPYADLATQIMMLPTAISTDFAHLRLGETWSNVCKLMEESYGRVRRRDGGVAKRTREIAAAGAPRVKAEALYRFVRDEIQTAPFLGVYADYEAGVDKVLSQRRGGRAEKALLLQSMLQAARIDSRLVWAGDRRRGAIDPQLVYPGWFDTVLVLVELDGEKIFLDPSDRALGFGQLQPGYEGTPALIHDPEKPEVIVLPETPFDRNLRRAEIDLALDSEGRLSGTGTLRLTGHHAWQRTDWQEDEAKTLEAWKTWLGESYRDFQISDVKVVEAPDKGAVTLSWTMKEREEEVLGDETRVVPSAPLGPRAQPFVQPADSRRSPVMFDFPEREEVELRLRWPEGWGVETLPKLIAAQRPVGSLSVGTELNDAERTLVYRRRLDITRKTIASPKEYEAIRSLFSEMEKSDAQAVLLVRR